MQHRYRVTLQHLSDTRGAPVADRMLSFETTNHDDIPAILERIAQRNILPADETAPFVVGLKLFGEVLLHHRGEPLFADLAQQFGLFMKNLKKTGPDETTAEA